MANVYTEVRVPVVPEQPKMVASQQLFVYVNKDVTGGRYYTGSLLTGKSASFTTSAIPNAVVGDIYLNTSTGEDRGNIYKCIVSASNEVSIWSYAGNTSTVIHSTSDLTYISLTIDAYNQYAFTVDIAGNISLDIPTTFQGYIAEVDFTIPAGWTGTFNVNNNSGKNLIFMRDGMVLQNYSPAIDCKTNLLFRDNGIDVLCVVVEIGANRNY